jgi:hypothetical protein
MSEATGPKQPAENNPKPADKKIHQKYFDKAVGCGSDRVS